MKRLVENEHQEDKKDPVQKTACVMSCTLLHGIPVTAVRKRGNTSTGLALGRAKPPLKNQKNAFGKKSKQENHRHNEQLYLL